GADRGGGRGSAWGGRDGSLGGRNRGLGERARDHRGARADVLSAWDTRTPSRAWRVEARERALVGTEVERGRLWSDLSRLARATRADDPARAARFVEQPSRRRDRHDRLHGHRRLDRPDGALR